jgi:hypothetical protein
MVVMMGMSVGKADVGCPRPSIASAKLELDSIADSRRDVELACGKVEEAIGQVPVVGAEESESFRLRVKFN